MAATELTKNPITTRIAENVKALRDSLDLSRREFGERIGRSAQNIMYWETERSEVSQACMALMAAVFNLDPFWFLEDHSNREKIPSPYQLPPPPPGTPSELVDWVKSALKASRDPLTQIEHVVHSNSEIQASEGFSLYGALAPRTPDSIRFESAASFSYQNVCSGLLQPNPLPATGSFWLEGRRALLW